MDRKILLLFLLFGSLLSKAQQKGSITGQLYDTLRKINIPDATISILNSKDSSLVSFTMTDNNGRFGISRISKGDYRLLVSHTAFHNYNKHFSITDDSNKIDLGTIVMTDNAKLLSGVVVVAEAPPVTLINDTVQYNASSFKTAPNANVEQLLKKLPGVKVEKDGTVKAQGEKVKRVLVDGKEFFGNDPKIATKNLPADAVDKVQVYDKQNDQSQLTGFDDGNYEKTINLKLKKDRKKGDFGKISAGIGTTDRYEGRGNLNEFKGARQISVVATANNTNAEGFSVMDILNFSGELNRMQQNGGSNMSVNLSQEDAEGLGLGGKNNVGVNTIQGVGVNYNNIIGTKLDLQTNYFYNNIDPIREVQLQRQYLLPDSSYNYAQNARTENRQYNQRLNLNALFQLDSSTTLRIVPAFNYQKTNNSLQSEYQTTISNFRKANSGVNMATQQNAGFSFTSDISFRKKLSRKGRSFSIIGQTSYNTAKGSGALKASNMFYDPSGVFLNGDTLDQENSTSSGMQGFTAKFIYTEPVFKKSLFEFSFVTGKAKSTSDKQTYDYDQLNGKYNLRNDQLSNNFVNEYSYNNAGVRFRTQRHKYNYSFGLTLQNSALSGKNITLTDTLINKKFTNILGYARFQYNFSKLKTFAITYSSFTNPPSITQLQPVRDNTDPLNVKIGNAQLKQEYVHGVQAHLNLVTPYKNKSLFVMLNAQQISNKIVNNDLISSQGIKTIKPVNVNGVYRFDSDVSYAAPLHFVKALVELSNTASYSNSKQFINDQENKIRIFSIRPEIKVEFNPANTINFSVGMATNYSGTKYSILPAFNIKSVEEEYSGTVNWDISKKLNFATDFTYSVSSQRASGYNQKIPIWNVSLARQLLNFNRGELKLSVMDLLDRNESVNRSTNQNYIEDSKVKTIHRFFLLSFTYSLNKTGLSNSGGNGMRIIAR